MKEFNFTPILGWSVSRFDTFNQCKRRYYYNYYPKYDKEFSRQKIEELKKMTSTALETGNIVHDIFKVLLERLQRNDAKLDMKRFYDYAHKITNEYCQSKTFSEVYYQQQASPDTEAIYSKVKNSLSNFLSTSRFSWILENAMKNRDSWVIEPPGYGETRIEGLKAYCKVDFLFPVDDRLYIIDWKTGKPNSKKHKKQMIGYTAWASYHFEVNPQKITPIVAYLHPEYMEVEIKVDQKDVNEFNKTVQDETKVLYEFCQDIDKNIPKEKELFELNETRLCEWCNYRELCRSKKP